MHRGVSQLRESENIDFPRICRDPSELLIGCSHTLLCNSEGERSQIFTLAHGLPCPFFVNLWNTAQVTTSQEMSPCALSSPNMLWPECRAPAALLYLLHYDQWQRTCLLGSWAVICLFLWSLPPPPHRLRWCVPEKEVLIWSLLQRRANLVSRPTFLHLMSWLTSAGIRQAQHWEPNLLFCR